MEDAGLFIEVLNGFPGPYSAYVFKTIGNKGVLQLMQNCENRKAEFQSVVAYYSKELESPICFKGKTVGDLSRKVIVGELKYGFGFDPIFKPKEKSRKTFGEMSVIEKNKYSHRAKALRKFAEWYQKAGDRKNYGS